MNATRIPTPLLASKVTTTMTFGFNVMVGSHLQCWPLLSIYNIPANTFNLSSIGNICTLLISSMKNYNQFRKFYRRVILSYILWITSPKVTHFLNPVTCMKWTIVLYIVSSCLSCFRDCTVKQRFDWFLSARSAESTIYLFEFQTFIPNALYSNH